MKSNEGPDLHGRANEQDAVEMIDHMLYPPRLKVSAFQPVPALMANHNVLLPGNHLVPWCVMIFAKWVGMKRDLEFRQRISRRTCADGCYAQFHTDGG